MTEKESFNETKSEATADDAAMDNVLHAKDNNNCRVANVSQPRLKRAGMEFYTKTLGSPKYIVSMLDVVIVFRFRFLFAAFYNTAI